MWWVVSTAICMHCVPPRGWRNRRRGPGSWSSMATSTPLMPTPSGSLKSTRGGSHDAIRGNVETEIARSTDIGARCGCAYPDHIADETVQRSNEVIGALRVTAQALADVPDRLRRLPLTRPQVGDLRIGMVHGDPTALAGWGLAIESLDDPRRSRWLADVAAQA